MVTLEINSTDIRLIEIRGNKIVNWANQSLRPGMFTDGAVSDPQALGEAVRQLLASSGVREKKIIASVSGLYSVSRMTVVPTPPEQPLTEQTVLPVIHDLMPLSPKELYISWQTIAARQGGQEVLVVGVPRNIIDGVVRGLKSARVKPYILDLKTLALARAVNRKEALVLNIDAASFDIVIVTGGATEILRTTAWQPESLSVEEKAAQLISALELTVRFHDSHRSASPLQPTTPLFITGQMAGDIPLIEHLQNGLAYALEPLAPLLEYPPNMPVSQYAVNIGLALKAAAKARFDIRSYLHRREVASHSELNGYLIPDMNLLPQAYQAWRPSARLVFSSLAVALVLGLLISLYRATTDAVNETAVLKQRYVITNNVMERRKAELRKREPLQQAIGEYDALVARGGGLVDDLTAIRNLAVQLGVEIGSINHSGKSITFDCQASDYQAFRDFVRALEENGRFTTPVIPPEGYPYIKEGTITLTPKTSQ